MQLITIEGTITIDDVDSQFSIDNAVGHSWEQWGATKERLVESMHIVQTLQKNMSLIHISETTRPLYI